MSSRNQQSALLRSTRYVWLLLCMSFIFSSLALPAYGAQMLITSASMSNIDHPHDMSMSDSMSHGTAGHQQIEFLSSGQPCNGPDCHNMSECTDKCSMNTCCNSPSVFNALSIQLRSALQGDSGYQLTNEAVLTSRRPDPLFRPPIT